MPNSFNFERAALVLADAVYCGDVKAARKHGVSTRSLRGWRDRLEADPIFAEYFLKVRERYESEWAKALPDAIIGAIAFLEKAATEADPKDPKAIEAIAQALKTLTDTAIAKQVIDGRSQLG